MHRHLHSPTKLTEFARDFDAEEPDTLFGKFVNRLTSAYNTGYNTVNAVNAATASPVVPAQLRRSSSSGGSGNNNLSNNNTGQQPTGPAATPSEERQSSLSLSSSRSNSSSAGSGSAAAAGAAAAPRPPQAAATSHSTRSSTPSDAAASATSASASAASADRLSQSGVLGRISNLMAMRNASATASAAGGLTSYKDTELQRFWMPDAKSKECYECTAKFTTFRRRHHCRLCGQIFCAKCCAQQVPGRIINCAGELKVCAYCAKIVLSYLKSADINADLRQDLRALQADLAEKLSGVGAGAEAGLVVVGGSERASVGGGERGGGGAASDRRTSAGEDSCGGIAVRRVSHSVAGGGSGGSDCAASSVTSTSSTFLGQQQQHLLQRKVSVGYQEERLVSAPKAKRIASSAAACSADRQQLLLQSQSLRAVRADMEAAMRPQLVRSGAELQRWLLEGTELVASAAQARGILGAMLEAGLLQPVVVRRAEQQQQQQQPALSSDDDELLALLEFSELRQYRLADLTDSGADDDPNWVHMTRGTAGGDGVEALDEREEERALGAQVKVDVMVEPADEELGSVQDISFGFTTSKVAEMQNAMLSTAGSKPLMEAFCEHEELLLNQLLAAAAIPAEPWAKLLPQLCAETVNAFQPGECGMMILEQQRRSMDIRHFVNFKKVPGGQPHESRICGGIAITKNVVHKAMASRIDQPRVLLLRCAIVYQRVEGKFVSIETLLLQEREYLRNVTARILQLRPNVVLVHRTCAGLAQDMLREHGITLVLDVKLAVLERLARSLRCDIVEAIDSNVGRPKLGTCDRFSVRTFEGGKTLMFFEQQSLQRGCCVLLRGAPEAELVRVKRVARMLLYARYNWRLELALLLDEFARPPSPRAALFDSKDQSPVREEGEEGEVSKASAAGQPEVVQPVAPPAPGPVATAAPSKAEHCKVTKQNVQDFSDPLRAAVDLSPSAFDQESSVEFAVETPYDNRFRTALSGTVLSVSPFSAFPLPYLETESGRKCALRRRFPQDLYYSAQWSGEATERPAAGADEQCAAGLAAAATIAAEAVGRSGAATHEFLTHKFTKRVDSREMQAMWASFRANGGQPATAVPSAAEPVPALRHPGDQQQSQQQQQQLARIDALAIDNHQRLPVLFCSFHHTPKPSTYCAPPSLLRMTFYGEQDIMLGQFLEHYCFRRSYMCKSCQLPMLRHVRRFVHSGGCVQVKLDEDHSAQNTKHILMTSWCSVCHTLTPSVPIAVDTWCLSFAKYLEHRFHSHAYRRRTVDAGVSEHSGADSRMTRDEEQAAREQCTHSMHRDHVHYFSFNGIVASFVYTPVASWSLALPATVRQLHGERGQTPPNPDAQHLEECKLFGQTGYEVFARIHERLASVAADADPAMLLQLKHALNRDQLHFRDRVNRVQSLLTGADPVGGSHHWSVADALCDVKRTLAENIEQWTVRLNDAAQVAATIAANMAGAPVAAASSSGGGSQHRSAAAIDSGTICTEDLRLDSPDRMARPSSQGLAGSEGQASPAATQRRSSDNPADTGNVSDPSASSVSPTRPAATAESSPALPSASKDGPTADKKSVKTLLRELLPTDRSPAAISIASPLPPAEHYCLSTSGRFPVVVHDQDVSSVIAFSLVSVDYKRHLDARQQQQQQQQAQTAETSGGSSGGGGAVSGQPTVASSSTASTLLSAPAAAATVSSPAGAIGAQLTASPQLIGPRRSTDGSLDGGGDAAADSGRDSSERKRNSTAAAHVEVQFSDTSTVFTCKTYFALEFDRLRASLIDGGGAATATAAAAAAAEERQAAAGGGAGGASTVSPGREAAVETDGAATTATVADGRVEEVRELFARSLCRSVQWEARGGKSGSKFCKTMDDRFVLKEMSKIDVSIFENFAPKYFEYIAQCLQRDEPTLLAKIFGVYRVTIRKKDHVLEKSLLVMENLFYGSCIDSKYDLKGSDRNRLVTTTSDGGGAEHVLLDENLIQKSWSQPLYILGHSQAVLLSALIRDTTFLERNEVMDYSLLVGLNRSDKVMVLGIIDYIRTFTLDKRIESLWKKSALLGGQGKLPTVISPKQYKQRFIEAMERYFMGVPDRWHGLAQAPE